MHTFDIALSDIDRGIYEALSLSTARHPSESAEYLVARVVAYALERTDGIAFTQGLSDADAPAIEVRDLTGALTAWIEVGTPSSERLHRATKACERVAVYCHKDPAPWLRQLATARIHAPERLHLFALDRALVSALASALDRRVSWSISRTEGELYIDTAKGSHSAPLVLGPDRQVLWFAVAHTLTWATITACAGWFVLGGETLIEVGEQRARAWRSQRPCTPPAPGDQSPPALDGHICIPIAAADLPIGHRIGPSDITGRWLPPDYVPDAALRLPIEGIVASPILAGEPLRAERLERAP